MCGRQSRTLQQWNTCGSAPLRLDSHRDQDHPFDPIENTIDEGNASRIRRPCKRWNKVVYAYISVTLLLHDVDGVFEPALAEGLSILWQRIYREIGSRYSSLNGTDGRQYSTDTNGEQNKLDLSSQRMAALHGSCQMPAYTRHNRIQPPWRRSGSSSRSRRKPAQILPKLITYAPEHSQPLLFRTLRCGRVFEIPM